LKVKCDGALSNFAFKFKLRRYSMVCRGGDAPMLLPLGAACVNQAGAYTRPPLSST
jgi:hypothetical protein